MAFNEDFALTIGGQSSSWWETFLTGDPLRVLGEPAPQPGVRVQIRPDVVFRDYPARCCVAVPHVKADTLIASRRADRVE